MRKYGWRWAMLAALVVLPTLSSCRDRNADPGRKLSETELWDQAVKDNHIKTFERFLSEYPASEHGMEAKRALKDLWKDEADKLKPEDMKKLTAVIETNRGEIKFQFFPDDAPNTCRNFIRLAQSHFYDELIFHRVIADYLIQGGDPFGNGKGNPGYTIPQEFNSRQHQTGTVAMARGGDRNSAGSQFYITLSPQQQLDNRYTVFGQVIEGMTVVQDIGKTPTDKSDKPEQDQIMKRVYIKGLPSEGK
jgi:cyclophilin family peptidyl-prolyl cis-trans isomerase